METEKEFDKKAAAETPNDEIPLTFEGPFQTYEKVKIHANFRFSHIRMTFIISYVASYCDAMMHVLKDSTNLKYSELLTKVISKCNFI